LRRSARRRRNSRMKEEKDEQEEDEKEEKVEDEKEEKEMYGNCSGQNESVRRRRKVGSMDQAALRDVLLLSHEGLQAILRRQRRPNNNKTNYPSASFLPIANGERGK
jgi:GTPase SAR1 family protein